MRRPYIHFFHIRCFSRDRLLSITAISLTTEIGKSAYRSSDNPEVGLFGVKLTYNGLWVEVNPRSPEVSLHQAGILCARTKGLCAATSGKGLLVGAPTSRVGRRGALRPSSSRP